jgi:hypothetical protein
MLKPILMACLFLGALPNLSFADAKVSGLLYIEQGGGVSFPDGILSSANGVTGPTGPQGVKGDSGPQGIPGPTSIGSCPSGMTRIDLQWITVCYAPGILASWDQADDFCDMNFRARICTLQEWRDVVCRAGIPNPGSSWTQSPTGAGIFATISACGGANVSTSASTSLLHGPCCVSWPRY